MKFPPTFVKDTGHVNIIIETPKGCNSKYNWNEESGLFKLSKILPEGLVFPQHFGFIPYTKGEDGDPLDALVLAETPAYPGVFAECRVLGAIEAEQKEKTGRVLRNDRIIAAAIASRRYSSLTSIKDMDASFVEEITKFFITYNEMSNKKFTPVGYGDSSRAIGLIKQQLEK